MAAFAYGIAFFVIGCVKKVFLADPLAGVAIRSSPRPRSPAFGDAWLGALAFFQLFLDFSAYWFNGLPGKDRMAAGA